MSTQTTTDEQLMIERVARLMGLGTEEDASRALHATFATLGEWLPRGERVALRRRVPPSLADELSTDDASLEVPSGSGVEDFFEAVQQREGTTSGFAREHAQVVCRVLLEVLDDETIEKVAHALPAPLSDLFHPPSREGEPPPHGISQIPAGHTLSQGRLGSAHPLSEAHPDDTQHHSVAREANPHGDTKLSSSSGLTQERLEESMATAHPDTRRQIAKASR